MGTIRVQFYNGTHIVHINAEVSYHPQADFKWRVDAQEVWVDGKLLENHRASGCYGVGADFEGAIGSFSSAALREL